MGGNKRIRIAEHPLEINLLFAVWTGLLLSNYTPTTNAELMKSALSFVKKNINSSEQWDGFNYRKNKIQQGS